MNKAEKVLLWGSNIWNFADGMFGPLLAIFTERIGGSILDISWAWAIYLAVTGILVIIVGKISDHFPKEPIMLAGYVLTAIFTFGYLFVSSPTQLFLLQGGLGIALALSNPTWMALYSLHADRRHEGATWALADGEVKILTARSIMLGGFIVSRFSFAVLFIIMGSLQVLASIYQAQILWLKKKPTKS